ncbi:MAG: ATP-binding protein, partial [Anaerolineales bacterium]
RKFLFLVVDINYNKDYDSRQILAMVHENPKQPFDDRSLEYYCAEIASLRLEGEFTNRGIENVYDQPTVLQTFLHPTNEDDEILIANPDTDYGFSVGTLRNGPRNSSSMITLEDRFAGYRTLISGASGFGKSTLVRNIARYWLENKGYGKIIDDLKGEYIDDIKDERDRMVQGLCHHPNAKQNLYLLTTRYQQFNETQLPEKIAGIIPLSFDINDIPIDCLEEIASLSEPQRSFLERYQDKQGLFTLLLRTNEDGDAYTDDWHKLFKGWIVATKTGQANVNNNKNDYTTDLADFDQRTYTPILYVRRHLEKLSKRPYMNSSLKSCLPRLRQLLKDGATIILDKGGGLTDSDKNIISIVIANDLYKNNEKYSSGNIDEQKKVIPFVYLVEEAHLLLSQERAKEGSTFVNFAKTGRSFQIGLAAVTQRPSGVDTNILSQFDNYITFRLTNDQDAKDLVKAKSDFQGYEGDIRTMKRGAAITAFGEPTKVQSIQVFEWTKERSATLLSVEQTELLKRMNTTSQQTELNEH